MLSGTADEVLVRLVRQANPASSNAYLVVADSTSLTTLDQSVKSRLEGLGWTVTAISDETAEPSMSGYSLVVICESVASATLGTKYATVSVPVVLLSDGGAGQNLDFNSVGGENTTGSTETAIRITDPEFGASAGYPFDVTVWNSTGDMRVAQTTSLGSGGRWFCSVPSNNALKPGYYYEAGATMANSHGAAEARRIFLGWFHTDSTGKHTSDAWALFDAAIKWASTTPTQFTDAYEADEVLGNKVVGVGFMAVYTQPGTTETVTLEFASSTTSQEAILRWAQVVAINLDDIGTQNTDYWYTENTTDSSYGTTPTDAASVTFSANGTDKYLYIANVTFDWVGDPTTTSAGFDLVVDGTTQQRVYEEGEDQTNEQRNRLLMWAETPTNASHTVKVQGYSEAGTIVQHLSSRVFVLNLSAFSDVHIATPADHQLTALDTWQNAWTTSFTPAASGDYFVMSLAVEDYGSDQNPDVIHSLQINPDGNGLHDYPGTLATRDTFTEASGTPLLSAHTPDGGGTWVERWQQQSAHWYVNSTNDTADLNGGGDDFAYAVTNLSSPTLADGYVEYQVTNSGDGVGMHVRWKGTSAADEDCYRIRQGSLYRVTNGSATSLGTVGSGPWYRLYASSSSPTQLIVFGASTQDALRTTFTDAGFTPALATSDSTAENQTASGEVGLYGLYDDFGSLGGNIDNVRVVADPLLVYQPDGGAWDASDETPWLYMDTVPFASGASRTINLDHRQSSAATTTRPSVLNAAFVAFSKALAGGGGTQYQQALTAALSPGAVMGRTANRVLDAATASLSPAVTFSAGLAQGLFAVFTATLAPAGDLAKSTARSLAASIAPAGAIARSTSRALAATLAPAGALARASARALTATLAPAGALTKSTARALAGSLSFTGSVTRRTARALAGALGFTGAITRSTAKQLAGALSFVGDLFVPSALSQSFTATLTFAGSVSRSTARALAGAIGPSGSLVRSTQRALAASLAPAGAIARSTQRTLTASLAPAGALARSTAKALAGALGPSGALVRSTRRALAATLTPAGNLQSQLVGALAASFDAALTFASALGRTADRVLDSASATLTPAGALSPTRKALLALTAALSFAGNLGRSTARQLAASLSPSGALAAAGRFVRSLTASLAPAGSLAARAGKSFAATLAPAGSLVRRTSRALTAILSPLGNLGTQLVGAPAVAFDAALTFSGAVSRSTSRALAASLAPAGDLAKRTARALSAILSPAATLTAQRLAGVYQEAFNAVLTFSGAVTRRTQRAFSATLPTTAQLARSVRRSLAATLTFAVTFGRGRFMAFTASLSFVGAFVGAARMRLASRLPAFARGVGAAFSRTRGSTATRPDGTSGTRTRGSTNTRD